MPDSTLRPGVGDGEQRRVGRVELGHSEEILAGEEEQRKLAGGGWGALLSAAGDEANGDD